MSEAPTGWKLQLADAQGPPAIASVKSGSSRRLTESDDAVSVGCEMYRFSRTPEDEPFAVQRDGPAIMIPLRGAGSMRAKLAAKFQKTRGKTPSSSSLNDAMQVFEGLALEATPEPVYVRIAPHAGGVVVDLADNSGRCVIVQPGTWHVHERSPVLFRRTVTISAMPEPQRGGKAVELRKLMNVSDDAWPMLLGWTVAGLIPDIAHPVLLFVGEAGAGKSTAAQMLVSLIDPGPVPLRPPPRDDEQLAITVAGSNVVCFDNVSVIPNWWSDAICRMTTGTGWLKRMLYADSSVVVLKFRRTMILTGIDLQDLRGDLASRMVMVDLERIDGTHRRADTELWARFNERAPFILGAILDLVADVLLHLPDVRLASSTRMADFSRTLKALDDAHGTGALDAYVAQEGRLSDVVIDSDPFAEKLIAMMTSLRGAWQGTSTELLLAMPKPNQLPKNWPATPQAVGMRLTRVAQALRDRGFEVEQLKESGAARRRLWRIEPPAAMRATADDVFPVTEAASTPPAPERQQQLAELTTQTQTIERPPDAADEHGHEQEGDDA